MFVRTDIRTPFLVKLSFWLLPKFYLDMHVNIWTASFWTHDDWFWGENVSMMEKSGVWWMLSRYFDLCSRFWENGWRFQEMCSSNSEKKNCKSTGPIKVSCQQQTKWINRDDVNKSPIRTTDTWMCVAIFYTLWLLKVLSTEQHSQTLGV